MTLWCLACGEPFDPKEIVSLGRWTLGPYWSEIDGQRIAIAASGAKALYAVAQGKGRPVNRSFVAEFSCSERASHPLESLKVRLFHMREKLGAAYPLVTVGEGLSWRDPLSGTQPGEPHCVKLVGDKP